MHEGENVREQERREGRNLKEMSLVLSVVVVALVHYKCSSKRPDQASGGARRFKMGFFCFCEKSRLPAERRSCPGC